MSKQQTAVEWLVNELTKYGYVVAPSFGHSIIDETINKAKQMELQQIIDAFDSAQRSMVKLVGDELGIDTSGMPTDKEDAEQYYKETYE